MKEDLKHLIEKNELITMCKNHFDSETVRMGINELIDTFMLFIDKQVSENDSLTYYDLVQYLKTKPVNTFITVSVMPIFENNNYNIEVFLDNDEAIICGDFGQQYNWNELVINNIKYD